MSHGALARLLGMKTLTILALALATPAAALAEDQPTPQQVKNAQADCRSQKQGMGATTFAATYGTNANKSNAFGKCVSKMARAEQAAQADAVASCRQQQSTDPTAFAQTYGGHGLGKCVSATRKATVQAQVQAIENAAKACKKERTADPAAFKAKYGLGATKANAFGKCVSAKAKAQQQTPTTSP